MGDYTGGIESEGGRPGGRLMHQLRQETVRLSWGVEHIPPILQLSTQRKPVLCRVSA